MSEESGGFAPPPFNADNALITIKRALRDMKLAERGDCAGLLLEPVDTVSARSAIARDHLDRHFATQARVLGAV